MVFLFYYLKKYENRMRFFGIMSAKQTIIKVKSIENQMINNAFKYPRRDLNPYIRRYRILSPACLPVPPPGRRMERKTGLEPATPTLARLCSTS